MRKRVALKVLKSRSYDYEFKPWLKYSKDPMQKGQRMKVKIKLVDGGKMPVFNHEGDACCDCFVNWKDCKTVVFSPFSEVAKVPLGFAIELPKGYEAVVRPRSGLSSLGIEVSIGTVDSNYRGEVMAITKNTSDKVFSVKNGDRICQLAIRKTEDVEFEQVDELSDSERGTDGFGSTGV